MYPTLFTIGPLSIHSFGLMVALAFLSALYLMSFLVKRGAVSGLNEEGVSQFLIFTMLGGALGARFAYVCEHWSAEFAGRPFLEVLRFDKGGLMFYGGLFGAILAIVLFSRLKKVNLVDLLDLCAAILPLGHAFGRCGCFLNGCCYGRVADSAISVTYPPNSPAWCEQVLSGALSRGAPASLPVLPSQLIEAGANLILFAALFAVIRKHPARGRVSGLYLVSYAVIRFFTETLRSDPRMTIGVFSISQFLSLLVLGAGIAFLILSRRESSKCPTK